MALARSLMATRWTIDAGDVEVEFVDDSDPVDVNSDNNDSDNNETNFYKVAGQSILCRSLARNVDGQNVQTGKN